LKSYFTKKHCRKDRSRNDRSYMRMYTIKCILSMVRDELILYRGKTREMRLSGFLARIEK